MYHVNKMYIFVSEGYPELFYSQWYRELHPHDKEYYLVRAHPDYGQRLVDHGPDQAQAARDELVALFPNVLQSLKLYVSPSIRSYETAAIISDAIPGEWRCDHRLYPGMIPERFTEVEHLFRAEIGLRSFLDSLTNQYNLIVAPTNLLLVARYHLENLLPEEYEALIKSKPHGDIEILAYRSGNSRLERRIYWPYCPERSPNGGNWELIPNKLLTGEELRARAEKFPHLFDR